MIKHSFLYVLKLLLFLAALALAGWAALALWFDAGQYRQLSCVFLFLVLLVLLRIRPIMRTALVISAMFIIVLLWWLQIKPSNSRNWYADVAQVAHADIQGDLVTIYNV